MMNLFENLQMMKEAENSNNSNDLKIKLINELDNITSLEEYQEKVASIDGIKSTYLETGGYKGQELKTIVTVTATENSPYGEKGEFITSKVFIED